jgi:NAD(P)-dependent dehydrogenase (short-subunit alcohol dehydrogenase family)
MNSDPFAPARTWFITGVSSGFGRALAREALHRGDTVVGTLRDPAQFEAFAAEAPGRAHPVLLDVTQTATIRPVIDQVVATHGSLDVVVNNAGSGLIGALEEYDDAQIDRCLATNLTGPLHVLRAVVPHLRRQQSGRILNLTAMAGLANYAGFSVYGGAKAALDAISDALAQELAPLGIPVTAIIPGPFRTEFIGRSLDRSPHRLPEYDRTSGAFLKFLDRIQGKQPGDPLRAAAAIYELTRVEKPPRRFTLGGYAHTKTRKRLADLAGELDTWQHLGMPTDFPPV